MMRMPSVLRPMGHITVLVILDIMEMGRIVKMWTSVPQENTTAQQVIGATISKDRSTALISRVRRSTTGICELKK